MRKQIDPKQIQMALSELAFHLQKVIKKKGTHAFSSTHEISGLLDEEYDELKLARNANDIENFKQELFDIAGAAVFAIACIEAEALDW